MDEYQQVEQPQSHRIYPESDEIEVLLRAIDILSMEVLRLKSENETLKAVAASIQSGKRVDEFRGYQPESLSMKVLNFYRREGLKNTLKKIFSTARRR